MRRLVLAVLALAVAVLVGGAARAQITLVPGPPFLVSRAPQFIAAADVTCPEACRRGICAAGAQGTCVKNEDCGPDGPCLFVGTCAVGGSFCRLNTDCGVNGPCEHVCDFNRDGFADAVVTNPGSNKVTVLYGGPTGAFSGATDFGVARRLQGLATGDLNGDCLTDFAVATGFQNLAYQVLQTSDGTGNFKAPKSLPPASSALKDVALGHFDIQNSSQVNRGFDVVAVSAAANNVTVYVNAGGNQFNLGQDFAVGNRPKRVETADLDQNGLDDIISLNTGTAAADDVSILLNQTVTNCCKFSDPPTQFVVGVNALDMAIADVNNDGGPDILVLNAGQGTIPNSLSVSVLLNILACNGGPKQGVTCSRDADCGSSGQCKPTGRFAQQVPVALSCPSSLGGIPISCRAKNITAGDFNVDGFMDFAVSFETLAQASTTSTPGLLSAFAGRGDGGFDFATQVSVGFRPEGLVTADFTGDGVPDIGVAENGARSVRIVEAIGPALLPNGTLCNINRQCKSGSCIDGFCCDVQFPLSCPSGQFCNIPGKVGECNPPLPNGALCSSGNQCASQSCVNGFCCGGNLPPGTTQCPAPAGQQYFCNTGVCAPPSGQGTQCNDDQQCESPFSCTDFTCCELSVCPAGDLCNIPGNLGFCTAPGPQGNPCINSEQCQAGLFCVNDTCCVTDTGMASCNAGEVCNLPGSPGLCRLAPTPTPTATPTVTPPPTITPTFTPTPQPDGATCAAGAQCVSQACANGICCNLPPGSNTCPNAQSGSPQFCNISSSLGTCAPKEGQGQGCSQPSDCQSDNCDGSQCAPPKTPTPTATNTQTATATFTSTPTPLTIGDPCTDPSQCESQSCTDGFCCDLNPGDTACPNDSQSGAQQFCNIPGKEGTCATPRPAPGDSCGDPNNPDACDPGWFCNPADPTNPVCCDSATCPTPVPGAPSQRCDISSNPGTCSPQLVDGTACQKNTDCAPPLVCLQDPPPSALFHCVQAPAATPTLIPTQVPTATTAPDVQVSRGSGCSVGNGADTGGFWLFGGLPVLLWVRRYVRVHVRDRR